MKDPFSKSLGMSYPFNKPFASKPFGMGDPFKKPFGSKPFGMTDPFKKPFGMNDPFAHRSTFGQPAGTRPFGMGDPFKKPFGMNNPFNKPFGTSHPFAHRSTLGQPVGAKPIATSDPVKKPFGISEFFKKLFGRPTAAGTVPGRTINMPAVDVPPPHVRRQTIDMPAVDVPPPHAPPATASESTPALPDPHTGDATWSLSGLGSSAGPAVPVGISPRVAPAPGPPTSPPAYGGPAAGPPAMPEGSGPSGSPSSTQPPIRPAGEAARPLRPNYLIPAIPHAGSNAPRTRPSMGSAHSRSPVHAQLYSDTGASNYTEASTAAIEAEIMRIRRIGESASLPPRLAQRLTELEHFIGARDAQLAAVRTLRREAAFRARRAGDPRFRSLRDPETHDLIGWELVEPGQRRVYSVTGERLSWVEDTHPPSGLQLDDLIPFGSARRAVWGGGRTLIRAARARRAAAGIGQRIGTRLGTTLASRGALLAELRSAAANIGRARAAARAASGAARHETVQSVTQRVLTGPITGPLANDAARRASLMRNLRATFAAPGQWIRGSRIPYGSIFHSWHRVAAHRRYLDLIRRAPGREAAIYCHSSGRWQVIQGSGVWNWTRGHVPMVEAPGWILVEHYHPERNPWVQFPSPDDFQVLLRSWGGEPRLQFLRRTTGQRWTPELGNLGVRPDQVRATSPQFLRVTSRVRYRDPVTGRFHVTEFGYDDAFRGTVFGPYFINVRTSSGGRLDYVFRTLEEYHLAVLNLRRGQELGQFVPQ